MTFQKRALNLISTIILKYEYQTGHSIIQTGPNIVQTGPSGNDHDLYQFFYPFFYDFP